jgi:hypothetical protein
VLVKALQQTFHVNTAHNELIALDHHFLQRAFPAFVYKSYVHQIHNPFTLRFLADCPFPRGRQFVDYLSSEPPFEDPCVLISRAADCDPKKSILSFEFHKTQKTTSDLAVSFPARSALSMCVRYAKLAAASNRSESIQEQRDSRWMEARCLHNCREVPKSADDLFGVLGHFRE